MSEPSNIESEVPGEQELREDTSSTVNENPTSKPSDKAQTSLQETITGEVASANDITLAPVITVTKQETTLTKGEMKLQKVTVTEDISQASEGTKTSSTINRRLTYEIHTKIPTPTHPTNSKRDDAPIATHTSEKEDIDSRKGKTRIPRARFRQAIDKVKKEQKEMREIEAVRKITNAPRKSSIPRLKDSKIPHHLYEMKVSIQNERITVADEDEFDKIYREINEKPSLEISISNEECVSQVESSFDEIIHAYEEDTEEKIHGVGTGRVKQSRIPMLKRKSEHVIERPRNREKYAIKKSHSVDMDKDEALATQTTYTTETVTTEEIQGYTENSTESVIFRSETSFSNEYNTKKRQGITCDENVYDRILITDETFEDAEERYRISKFKQGEIDTDETVPIIDEPEDIVEATNVTESYDDISVTSETELTKISSEQVRFDKQIVSKIYKIDFTENTFELADSETTETSNEHIQGAANEAIVSSISKAGTISMFTDPRKTEDVVGDFKVSRYKTSSNNSTHDYRDEQKVTNTFTIESVQSSVTTKEDVGQLNTKHLIQTSGSVKNYDLNETKDQNNVTQNITDSIEIDTSMESRDIEKSIENSVIKCSTKEIREAAINVGQFNSTESTIKINDTAKTATYLSAKHGFKGLKDIQCSDAAENENVNHLNDLGTETSKGNAAHLISKDIKEIKETGNISADLITQEVNKEAEYTAIKKSNSSPKEIIEDDKDIRNFASALTRNVSTEVKQSTQNNEEILIVKQNVKDLASETSFSEETTNQTINTADLRQSVKETKLTTNFTSNKTKNTETRITNNVFNFDKQTISQSSTFKSNEDSYGTTKHSYSPISEKSPKPEANGSNDEETYKIYSDVFSKLSTTSKISTELETNTEKGQKHEDPIKTSAERSKNLSVPETGPDSEENTPILRGKVSRLISRISSVDTRTEEKEAVKDVPKKKSILSKIALFERDELYERIPKPKAPQPESKPLRGLAALRQTNRELRKPKIVDEIYKEYSERSAVRRSTNLLNDEEEITIEIKDIKNTAEVNRFDSAFKTKLNDDKRSEDKSQDICKTKYFYTQKEIDKQNGEEYTRIEEELTINVNNVNNLTNIGRTDSTLKSEVLVNEYKTFKNDTLRRAKSESFYSQEETKTEERRVAELTAANSSTTDLNRTGESKIQGNILIKGDEIVATTHYESSYKINNSATSSSNNISQVSNSFKRTISSPTTLTNTKTSNEPNNTLTISDRRKVLDRYKKSRNIEIDIEVIDSEESIESRSDKMVKRLRCKDPVLQRAISVVEDDLGEVIKGKVKGIISRINSLEKIELERKRNDNRNTPRGSVSERIALFEGKASSAKAEKSIEGRSWRNRTVEKAPKEMDDETCLKRIEELKEAKKTYGFTNASYTELRDGTKMPLIALGTALLDKRLVRQVVETAIDLGYRAIDTAFIYGNEKEIGEGIKAKIDDGTVKREDLYIISKLWSTFHRRDLVERACRSSLETMGLTYFDLYLIHNPMSFKEGGDPIPKIANVLQFSQHDFMDAWYGIEDLVSKGLVKSAGLSNFNSEQVHRVAEKGRLKPVVNQVECHPYLSQDRLAGFCEAYGMKLVCFGTLGSKGTPKNLKSSLPPAIEDPLVQVMAAGLGVSPAQLLVAFQIRKGRGVVAKASSASHLHDNLLAQRLPLATGQLTALGTLDRHKRTYTFEGMGDTHKNYPFKIAF